MSKYTKMDADVVYMNTSDRINFEFDMLNHNPDKYVELSYGFAAMKSPRNIKSQFKHTEYKEGSFIVRSNINRIIQDRSRGVLGNIPNGVIVEVRISENGFTFENKESKGAADEVFEVYQNDKLAGEFVMYKNGTFSYTTTNDVSSSFKITYRIKIDNWAKVGFAIITVLIFIMTILMIITIILYIIFYIRKVEWKMKILTKISLSAFLFFIVLCILYAIFNKMYGEMIALVGMSKETPSPKKAKSSASLQQSSSIIDKICDCIF